MKYKVTNVDREPKSTLWWHHAPLFVCADSASDAARIYASDHYVDDGCPEMYFLQVTEEDGTVLSVEVIMESTTTFDVQVHESTFPTLESDQAIVTRNLGVSPEAQSAFGRLQEHTRALMEMASVLGDCPGCASNKLLLGHYGPCTVTSAPKE